jgi:glutamate 5-kinase
MTSAMPPLDPLFNSMTSRVLSEPTQASEDDHVLAEKADATDAWEEVEVGRGLANYNSAQIAKLKGLNRCVNPSRWYVYPLISVSQLVHLTSTWVQ